MNTFQGATEFQVVTMRDDWHCVVAPDRRTVDAYLDLIDAIRAANLLTVRAFNEVRHGH